MSAPTLPPLMYRCPVCNVEVAVPGRMVGEVVRCPVEKCRQPILVDPPRAEFVGVAPDGVEAASLATKAPIDAERPLLVLRPEMARNSPVRFVLAWIGIASSAVGLIWAAVTNHPALAWLSVAGLLLLSTTLFVWWLNVMATTLTISTRRTTLRKGIFEKNTNEVQHDDVRNIQVDQNVIDRMMGVGTLKVSSSGQDDVEIVVDGILHPGKVAETIRANQ